MKLAVNTLVLLSLVTTSRAQCPTLIWSDEFEGDSLDDTKWSHMTGNGCDMGEGMCGWGNNEWSFYTSGNENVQVSDGTLKIIAKYDSASNLYTSARIRSLGKADFDLTKPLRLEARIKVPHANSQGLWPAFWMMPSNMEIGKWPLGGEIDIMEYIGKEPNATYGVMHYGHKWNDKNQKGGLMKFPEHAGNQFHTFAVEKTPKKLTWLLDGKQYLSFTNEDLEPKFAADWPFEEDFHFILNMAIGGNWPEYPDETTQFPNQLEVDYVRVYDLSATPEPTPTIEGDGLVRVQAQGVQYCVDVGSLEADTDYDTFMEWDVPSDATFYSDDATPPNCIQVNFGTQSGFVQAKTFFNCGRSYELQMPVEVQDYYGAEFAFLVPDTNLDQASYTLSTGDYTLVEAVNDTPAKIVYQRDQLEVYDHIYLSTNGIPDPTLYVQSAKKFFMDVWSPLGTAAPCTRFWIQLEDTSVATPDNYPVGRHSRYVGFLEKQDDWQRMEFDYYDSPDKSVTKVDQIVILIDAFVERSDIYELRNLVSAKAGCDPTNDNMLSCEPLSQNACQAPAKSEAGACTDGYNNDGFGWNGDGPTDCEDSDCFGLDPGCMLGGTSSTETTPAEATPAETTPAEATPAETTPPPPPSDATPTPAETPATSDVWQAFEYGDDQPESCQAHAECRELGLAGNCCSTSEGVFLACCEPRECAAHPECAASDLSAEEEEFCCPNSEGKYMACCNLDLPVVETKRIIKSQMLEAVPEKNAQEVISSSNSCLGCAGGWLSSALGVLLFLLL